MDFKVFGDQFGKLRAILGLNLLAMAVGWIINQIFPYMYPPFSQRISILCPLCVAGLTTTAFGISALISRKKKAYRERALILVIAVVVGTGTFYIWSVNRYVRCVSVDVRDKHACVVVGKDLTAEAQQLYAKMADENMLPHRGWSESDLSFYWTDSSLTRANLIVLISYCLLTFSINTALFQFTFGSIPRKTP